jgi:hypothetical protein
MGYQGATTAKGTSIANYITALAHTLKERPKPPASAPPLFDKRRELMDLWAHFATSTPATVLAIVTR